MPKEPNFRELEADIDPKTGNFKNDKASETPDNIEQQNPEEGIGIGKLSKKDKEKNKTVSYEEFLALAEKEYSKLDSKKSVVSHQFARLLAYRKLKKKHVSLEQPYESDMEDRDNSAKQFAETFNKRTVAHERFNETSAARKEKLRSILEKSKEASNLVSDYLEFLLRNPSSDFNSYREGLSKSGGAVGFDLNQTSFKPFFGSIFNAQMAVLLTEEQWEAFSKITTPEEADQFIQSKPLQGKKIAEIGGNQTSSLQLLGATVNNYETSPSEIRTVRLDNWEDVYEPNSYDLVSSHMVMDLGSGIEQMRPEYFTQRLEKYCHFELHSIVNKILKNGRVATHVGSLAYSIPQNLLEDSEQINRGLKVFGTSLEDGFWSNYRFSDYGFTYTPDEVFQNKLGFDTEVYLTKSETATVDPLTIFKKVGDSQINTFKDVQALKPKS